MGKRHLLFCFIILSVGFVEAQDTIQPILKKIYTTKPLENVAMPVLDGLLDDSAWDVVEWAGDYIENNPDENTPPSFQTKFKIVYDSDFLYIGVRCYDKQPDSIVRRLSRRDGFEGDWVEFNIDSYHDKRTAFSFTITAAGVKGDEFISDNGNNWDTSWNPIWYAKTNQDGEGWTAELKIPFSQLKFGKSVEQIWGLQSTRLFFRREERSLWQRKPVDTPGWVSEFGELHGLMNLIPQKQLEIQPYSVASLRTFEPEGGNPFQDGNDSKLSTGLDAKIGITNDLTLDLTINPDFGQVEADPSAIALDGFQIFFDEQRPFFVENKNIFDYGVSRSEAGNTFASDNLFYSRRIGRDPQGFPDILEGEYVEQPENTPILGAAKFSGKTKNGWSIGILESVTAKRSATIDNQGNRRREEVEPLTNYFVGRVQKDFNDRKTYIGAILTATNRDKLSPGLDFLHTAAYSGGMDFKHQWSGRDWYFGGNLLWSHVKGSSNAILNTQRSITHLFQRVDADYLEIDPDRNSLSGTGGNFQLGKIGNGHWRFESGATWRSPEFELNDIGFLRQADDIRHYTWIGYQTLKADKNFRRVGINYNHWSVWDFGGNHNNLLFNTNSWQNWTNYWSSNLGLNYEPIKYSNFALRGGPRLRLSPGLRFWNGIGTDSRKKIRFSLYHEGSRAMDNSYRSYTLQMGITYQPINQLGISVTPEYGTYNDKLQFLDNVEVEGETVYLNGNISQKTFSTSLRLNYTINPNLTVQYWGQPFISIGRYDSFKKVIDPLARDFNDRIYTYGDDQLSKLDDRYQVDENRDGSPDLSFSDPDFSFVQFRSNLVLRWEYIPGSEIFLVWSQDITRSGNPEEGLLEGLERNIFGNHKPQNIFLIKATYRFVL
tara:strand:+ start:17046 stop:19697 length:2652 start_codon:yes stop_codon:yes gene_type:complete